MDPAKKAKLQQLIEREAAVKNVPLNKDRVDKIPASSKKGSKYSDLNSVDLTIAQRLSTWSDSSFKQVRVYGIERLTTDEAVLFGKSVAKAMAEDSINADTVMMMLHLAVSLRSTGDVTTYLMDDLNDIAENTIETNRPVPDMEDEEHDDEQVDKTNQLAKMMAQRRKNKAKAATNIEAEIDEMRGTKPVRDNSDDKESVAAAYSYIAAFLLRLHCRESSKTITAFSTAKDRYLGFYDAGLEVFSEFDLTTEPMEAIRSIMARKPEIASTWVAWAAYSENEAKLIKQDLGLLQYLVLQVYAYMGMHVVTQTLAIHQITKVPMGFLLSELDCRITRSAVIEVYNILKNHHKNSVHPDRKTYFRYARLWDEAYFTKVQSKNCPQLLYLTARTVKELSPNSLSDPTQIYAVKNMSDALKTTLDEVSDKLIQLIYESAGADEESGSIWANMGKVK